MLFPYSAEVYVYWVEPGGPDSLTQLEHRDSGLNSLLVDLPEPELLMKQKYDVIARFLEVLQHLVEVYEIPRSSLHIFADKEGRIILCNRRGVVFLNLVYFEAWRTSWVSALL